MRNVAVQSAVLVVLTCAAYFPALEGQFVWDDVIHIVNNELLGSVDGLWMIWTQPSADKAEGHYWPVVYSSFWLDHQLWGLRPLGYHLNNILLHCLNVLLLWYLFRRLDIPGSWFAAAIFALHPVHVESVAWIIERKDVLCCAFYLLALWAFLRWDSERRGDTYILSLQLYAAALLSKSIAVSLPLALGILIWWRRRRLTMSEGLALIPFIVIALVLIPLDIWLMHEADSGSYPLSWVDRCLVAGRAVWFYAAKLVWPANLTAIYPRWQIDAHHWAQYVYVVAMMGAVLLLWLLRLRIGRAPLAAVLFFVVSLGPILGFIDFAYMGQSFVADRYQYLASIGPIVMFAALWAACFGRFRAGRIAGPMVGALLLAVLFALTFNHSAKYRDAQSLFGSVIDANPNSWQAHHNLGHDYLEKDRLEDAAEYLTAALRLYPNAKSYHSLGLARAKQKRVEEAIDLFEKALELDPDRSDSRKNIALAMLVSGEHDEAAARFAELLRRDSQDVMSRRYLGEALMRIGQARRAAALFEQVIAARPDIVGAANSLAWILATHPDALLRDGPRAIALTELVRAGGGDRRPEHDGTLAAAYAETGRYEEAIATAEKAIELAVARGMEKFATKTRQRITLYRDRKPYRDLSLVESRGR